MSALEQQAKVIEQAAEKAGDKAEVSTKKSHPLDALNETASQQFAEMRHDPEIIKDLFRSGKYPYKNKIKKQAYEQHLKELQVELLKVQSWVKKSGERIVILFEDEMPPARAALSNVSWST